MPGRHRESAAGQLPLTRGQQVRSQVKHLLENWFLKTCFPGLLIRKKYAAFLRLRQGDRQALELISRLEEIKQKSLACDHEHTSHLFRLLDQETRNLVEALIAFNPLKYALLRNYHRKYAFYAHLALMEDVPKARPPYVLNLSEELSEEMAGGKGTTLSTLLRLSGFPVPPGLVLTPGAFYLMLQDNRLTPLIQAQLSRLGPQSNAVLYKVSQTIQDRLLKAEMPRGLESEVKKGLMQVGIADSALALRSSAVGEDLQASFAGQFESRLNVAPDNWFEAYKRILSSKYSPHALNYRINQGFTDWMTPMAVLIMPTIQATVSGILYSRDPGRPERAILYMVSGTGESLAGGSAHQAFAGFDLRRRQLLEVDVRCPLAPETLRALFEKGQQLEETFGAPQDVEWVMDENERIFIVQSRPLRLSARVSEPESEASIDYPADQILIRGHWVSSGRASGRIHKLSDPHVISEVPEQAVLVTDELPPELTLALNKVNAVIAEKGSPACHFASVAREAGIPVICSARGAMALENGQAVSLDSDQEVVLAGDRFKTRFCREEDGKPDSPAQKKLKAALTYISPLSLQDPDERDISIQSCKSLHDIVRYVHEAGVREMFSLVGRRGLDSLGAKLLNSGLPLVMHVLDVHQGLTPNVRSGKTVNLEQIRSQPMQQVFAGLAAPAVKWDKAVLHYDWDGYAKSSASFVDVEKSTLFSSYAILDKDYLHALLRFGYHFAVLDTVQGQIAEQNYIHFSFKGGGGNEAQRFLRTQLIRTILEDFRFNVDISADFLEASFDRRSLKDTGNNLCRLGIVLGKTVLLDMQLKDWEQVQALAENIIREVYDFLPVQENQ